MLLSHIFDTVVRFAVVVVLLELIICRNFKNRAAIIVTSSGVDAPSRPLINELGWKTIDEPVNNESKIIVNNSQHQLAPQYLSSMFIKNSSRCSINLFNAETDLRLPLRSQQMATSPFLLEEQKLWNSLLVGTKQVAILHAFRKSLVPL